MNRKIRVIILTLVLTVLMFGGTRLMAQNENNSVDPQTTPTEENLESKNEGEEGASLVEEGKNTDIDSNEAEAKEDAGKTESTEAEANKKTNTEVSEPKANADAPKAKEEEKTEANSDAKPDAKPAAKEAEKPVETPDVKAADKTAAGNGPEDGAKLQAAPAKAPEAQGKGTGEGEGTGNGEDVDNGEPTKPVVEKDQIDKSADEELKALQNQIDAAKKAKDDKKAAELQKQYNEKYFKTLEKSGAEKLDDGILDRFTDKYRTKEYYALKEEYEALKKKAEEGKITEKEINAFNKKLGTFDPPRKLDDDEKSALEKLGKAPNFTRDLPENEVNTAEAKKIFEDYKKAKAALEKVLDAENTDGKAADFNKLLEDFNKAKNALDNALRKGKIQPYYTQNDTTELRLYNIDGSGKMPEELKQGTYYIPDGTALDLLVQVNKDKTEEFTFTISAVGQKGVEISKEYLSNLAFLNGEPVELVNKGDGTYTFTTKAGTNFGVAQIRFNMPGFRAAFHKGFTVTMSSNEKGAKDVKKTFLITKKGYEDYADLSGIGTKDKDHPQENVDAGPTDNGIVKEDTKEAFDFYTLLQKSNAYIDKVLVNSANGDALPLSSVDITITIPDYNGKFAEYIYQSGLKYTDLGGGKYQLKLDTKPFTKNPNFKVEDGKLLYNGNELNNDNIKEALKNSILEGKDGKKYIDADGNEYKVVDKNILEDKKSEYKVQDNKLYKKEDGNYKELGTFAENKLKATDGTIYELRGNTLLSYKNARTVYEGNVTNEGNVTDEKAAENVSETYIGKQVIVKDGDKESYGGTIVKDKIFKTEGDKEYYFNEQDKTENQDKYSTASTALISTEGKKKVGSEGFTLSDDEIIAGETTIDGVTYKIVEEKGETRLVGKENTYKLVTNAVFNKEGYILDGLTFKSGITLIDKFGRPIKNITVTKEEDKYKFTKEGVTEAKTSGEGSNITISGDSKIYVDNKNNVVVPKVGIIYNSIKGKYYYDGKKFVKVEDKDVKDGKYYTDLTTRKLIKKLIETYKKNEKEEVVIENPEHRYFGGTDANNYYKVDNKVYYKVEDGQGTYLVKADATSGAEILSANDIVKIVQTLGKGKELVTNETSIFDAVHNAKFKLMFPGFLAGKNEVYHIDAKVAAKYFEPKKDEQGNEILVEKSIFKDENKKEKEADYKEFSKYFTLKRSDKGKSFFFKNAPDELKQKLDYHFFNIFFRDEDYREERDNYVIELLKKDASGDYKDEKLKEVKDETEKKKLENERDFINILKAELKKINPDAEFKYDDNKLKAVYKKDGKEIEITRKLLWEIGFNNEAATIFPEDGDAEIVIEDHSMDNRLVYDEIIVNEEETKWEKSKEAYEKAKKDLADAENDKTKTNVEIEALKQALKKAKFEGTNQYFYIDKIKDIRFGVNPNFVEGRFIPLGKDFVLTSKEIIDALNNKDQSKNIIDDDGNKIAEYIFRNNKHFIKKGEIEFEVSRDEVKGQIKIKVLNAFYKKNDSYNKDNKDNNYKFYSPVQKAYEDKMSEVDGKLNALKDDSIDNFKSTFKELLKVVHAEKTECYGIISNKLEEMMKEVEKLKEGNDETKVKAELERIKKQLQSDIPKLKLQYLDTSKKTYNNDDMRFNAIRIALKPHLKIGGAMDETKTKKFGITSVIVPDIDIPYTDEFGKALTNKDMYVKAEVEKLLNDDKYKDYLNNEELFREVMKKAYEKVNDMEKVYKEANHKDPELFKPLVTISDDKFSLEKFDVTKGKDLDYKDLAVNGKESIKDSNGKTINPWYIGEGQKAESLDKRITEELKDTKEYKEAEESSIDLAAYYMSNKGYDRAVYYNNAIYKLDKEVQSAGIFENKDDWKSKMCYSGIIGKCLEDADNKNIEKPYGDDKNFGIAGKAKKGFELTYTPTKKEPDKENPKVEKKTEGKEEGKDKIDLSKEEGNKTVDFTISVTVDKKNLDQKKYELALDPKNTEKINESDYQNKFYIYKNALIMDILPDVFKLTAESSIEMTIDEKALKANEANSSLDFAKFKNGIKYFYTDDVLKYLEDLKKTDKDKAEVLEKALESKKVTGKQQAIIAWLPEFEAPHGSTNQFTLKLKKVLADKKKFKDFDDGVIGTIYTNHATFNNKADIYSGSSTVTITDGHEGKVNKYLQVLDKDGNPLKDEVLKQWFKGSVELKFGDKFNYKIKYYQDKNLIKTQANPFAVDSEWNLDDIFAKVKDDKGHSLRPVLRDYLDVPEGFEVTYTVGDTPYSKEQLEEAIAKGETSLSKVDKINIKGAYPDKTYQEFILPMMIPEFDAKVEDGKVTYIGTDGNEHELGKAEDFFDLDKLSKANEDIFATNTVKKSNTVTVYLDKERFIKLKKIFKDSEGKELKENLPEVEFKLNAYRIKLDKDGNHEKGAKREKVSLKDLGIEKDTLKLNEANNFFDAIYHLPLFKKTVKTSEEKTEEAGTTKVKIVVDGYMYEYELEEIPVAGYEFEGTKTYKLANGEDDPLGFVLEATNTEKPENPGDHPNEEPKEVKVTIRVNKVWEVLNNGATPSIKVQLYANGEPTDKFLTLGDGNWSAVFKDLPTKDKDGKDIVYTVVEVGETNHVTEIGERKFEVSYSIGEDGSITITNKEIPPEEPKNPEDEHEHEDKNKKNPHDDEEERDRTPKKNRIPKTGVNEDLGAIYFAFVLLLGLVFIKKRYLVK